MDTIKIYTDGASRGNGQETSISAWAAIVYNGDSMDEWDTFAKGYRNKTNNAMELEAVVEGLRSTEMMLYQIDIDMKTLFAVEIYSDSTYVVKAINEGWLQRWVTEGFMNKGQLRPNTELWKELVQFMSNYDNITFIHVKGHADNPYNNKADMVCNMIMDKIERGEYVC